MKTQLQQAIARIRPHITRRRAIIGGVVLAVLLILTPLATYAYFARDISNKERLMNRSDTGVILRDKNGAIFYEYGQVNGNDKLKLSEISDDFEKTVIASEDNEFYRHEGYSLKGIAGAMYANVLNKDPTRYGGSTITQQLVKNKLLTSNKNFLRKYQEVALAVAIERRYTKDEILEMYVNSVYFGEGAFGISDAAKVYFNKSAQDLTVAESSMLVGVLPAPTAYSPLTGDKELAKKQQARVLRKLVEAKVISDSEGKAILAAEVTYQPTKLETERHAQHFSLMVLGELRKKFGEERMIRSGFDVTTTLDLNWQKAAEEAATRRVAGFSALGARNATIVTLDPKSGQVRALVGSVDWENETFGKVNMALAERQPGSSFKPIFYTEALEKRIITPASIIKDEPKTYGGNYRPTNYDFRYRGNVTVRSALAQSMNIPAVEVMQKLGPEEASKGARRLGLSTVTEPEKYGLSLGLGTAEVKPYELANAYAAFANKGEQFTPTTFTVINDKFGDGVHKPGQPRAKKVISQEAAYLVSSILSDPQARAPTFSSLNIPNRQVAVKTGTTNDNRDAWTVGYTPSVATAVWMGNNENEPMRGLAGSSSAGVLWKDVMTGFLSNTPREDFQRPSGVVAMRICSTASGATNRGAYEEVFIKGTEPKEPCARPAPVNDDKKSNKDEEQEEEKADNPKPEKEDKKEEGGRGAGEAPEEAAPEPDPEEVPEEPAPTTGTTP